jgi:hypothetical protein
MLDCVEIRQDAPFGDTKTVKITLTAGSAEKLIPILERFLGIKKASAPGGAEASQGRKRPKQVRTIR